MEENPPIVEVYLEIGQKKTIAGALEWPGWCRSTGMGEAAALETLLSYGSRYARLIEPVSLSFAIPTDVSHLLLVERLDGDSTTDYGVPGKAPTSDAAPLEEPELQRLQAILDCCMVAFGAAISRYGGRELRKGPRGGGRDLLQIANHVLDASLGYLGKMGSLQKFEKGSDPARQIEQARVAMREGIAAAARGEFPPVGPRGGSRWSPRYFVRRAAWHLTDHLWEIEDRLV
jgi:hypothetical protein